MTDAQLYSWFLGPKAENADLVERLIVDALRDVIYWRRNFHPEDELLITEARKRAQAYQESVDALQQEYLGLLADLKMDIPFFSPRYIGHMLGDQLIPAVVAYFAAMLHNPNNVTLEASPRTTRYELEVAQQLARLMGYPETAWGHITSGGTIANFEALWVARNLKFLPVAAHRAARDLGLPALPLQGPGGELFDLLAISDPWHLVNLDPAVTVVLRNTLCDAVAQHRNLAGDDERFLVGIEVAEKLREHAIPDKGIYRFIRDTWTEDGSLDEKHAPGIVIAPATAHYSALKVIEALGIGKDQLRFVPVDKHFRTDIGALRQILDDSLARRCPVIALISVLGTTEEGAVDEIHKVASLRAEYDERGLTFHHHCDAAWGGYVRALFFTAADRPVRHAGEIMKLTDSWPSDSVFASFAAVAQTDSVTIDPHKLGYIPYPCGAVVFRQEQVRELISFDAPYVFREAEQRRTPFIGRYILEGSKPGAAAAACWFAHRIVPLNQSGYGALIGESIRAAQQLHRVFKADLSADLEPLDITVAVLTDPPDLNLVCFVVNDARSASLASMNEINAAISTRFAYNAESVVRHSDFIISTTDLEYRTYGMSGSKGTHSMQEHLDALGIAAGEFEAVKKITILRCTIMNPWIALSRGGNPDYIVEFSRLMHQTICHVIEERRRLINSPGG